MELKAKTAVVIGLADSGAAAARFLAKRGTHVIATDLKSAEELEAVLAGLAGLDIEFVLGGHPERIFAGADLVVVSPGVPRDSEPLNKARARGLPVLSELELAARLLSAPVIAVTGTNGKTTTVTLAGEIMKAGLGAERVFVGGNIGTPLIELALGEREVAAAVVEVSSFQLEFAETFHPRVAALLNVSADHLDRYRDFEDYAATKSLIFKNQTPDDFAVLNLDDPAAEKMRHGIKARLMSVSLDRPAERLGMWTEGGAIIYKSEAGKTRFLEGRELKLPGRHNLYNVMTASLAALALGLEAELVKKVAREFRGLPHRLEFVRERGGVRYYNDSKATNAGAVQAAALGLDRPAILLMGGQAKGCSFVELGRALAGRVKAVAAFGECRDQLCAELGPAIPVTCVETLAEALAAANRLARPGDAVILAPACASFDQFENYQHRGEFFKRLVMEIE